MTFNNSVVAHPQYFFDQGVSVQGITDYMTTQALGYDFDLNKVLNTWKETSNLFLTNNARIDLSKYVSNIDWKGSSMLQCLLSAFMSLKTFNDHSLTNTFVEFEKGQGQNLKSKWTVKSYDLESSPNRIFDIMDLKCETTINGSTKCSGQFNIFDSKIEYKGHELSASCQRIDQLNEEKFKFVNTEKPYLHLRVKEEKSLKCHPTKTCVMGEKNEGRCSDLVAEKRVTPFFSFVGSDHYKRDLTTKYGVRDIPLGLEKKYCPSYLGEILVLMLESKKTTEGFVVR